MTATIGSNIVLDGLAVFIDPNNSKCVDATQTITTGTRLSNLVTKGSIFGSMQFQPNVSGTTNGNMSFTQEPNGDWVYDQVSVNGGEPGWVSSASYSKLTSFSFSAWFKFQHGASFQRADNIYGGGWESNTAFYLSAGGTSSSHVILPTSTGGSISITSNYGASDGEWHQFTATDTGVDAAHVTKLYIDGEFKTSSSSPSYVSSTAGSNMTWACWSPTYGNMGGKTGCYMYYHNKVLTDLEVRQNYEAQRGRFGV